MEMSQLEFVLADTNVTPDTGMHSASNTIKNAGPGVRAAAATAAQALLGLASTQLGVPAAQLSVSKGVVSGGGKSVTYGAADRREALQRPDAGELQHGPSTPTGSRASRAASSPGSRPRSRSSQYKLVGTRAAADRHPRRS